jgi:hypothetical protein
MKSKFLHATNELYDGQQLRSLWNYLEQGILGDSVTAWVGPCKVDIDHMVDGEDLLSEQKIEGDKMVHFIIEKFDISLLAAVSLQRLFASIAMDWLKAWAPKKDLALKLTRRGDDIYLDGSKKLSISIATQSPVSSLIHFAVNVVNEGTPVPTSCLGDFGVDSEKFATHVMESFCQEVHSITEATQKVKWVR